MGYIPASESSDLCIHAFEEPIKGENEQIKSDSSKYICCPEDFCDYRYLLGRLGNKPIIVIGINPSTATSDSKDNTVKRVERRILNNGYDSYMMCNLYAQRSTYPKTIDKNFNEILHRENIKAYRWVFENLEVTPTIWAAWGVNIEVRSYLRDCLMDIFDLSTQYNSNWILAGKTKKGHPRHPLHLPESIKFETFDISEYLKKL